LPALTAFLQHAAVATPAYTLGAIFSRLLLSALLGGAIGVERESKHRPAGLRTNLFICFGSALFTMLSALLAGSAGDQTRIAAQIITGIGFIGAGAILHPRGGVQGLTTAATIFVDAGIGMAAGAGLVLPAVIATVLVLLGLLALGILERRVFVRPNSMDYELTAPKLDVLYPLLEQARALPAMRLRAVSARSSGGESRLGFTVEASTASHEKLQAALQLRVQQQEITSFSSNEEE
jgi:putative Mg2+ transporter-C (MgtC) family protein